MELCKALRAHWLRPSAVNMAVRCSTHEALAFRAGQSLAPAVSLAFGVSHETRATRHVLCFVLGECTYLDGEVRLPPGLSSLRACSCKVPWKAAAHHVPAKLAAYPKNFLLFHSFALRGRLRRDVEIQCAATAVIGYIKS